MQNTSLNVHYKEVMLVLVACTYQMPLNYTMPVQRAPGLYNQPPFNIM